MKRLFPFIAVVFFISCSRENPRETDKIYAVTTTTIISDLVQQIGGEKVLVTGLMGVGVDPHLYKASEGDVQKIGNADLIFYGGLHLEGKLVDVFAKMKKLGKNTIDLGESIEKDLLIQSENFGGNYDPHIWFDVELFKQEAIAVAEALINFEPNQETYFKNNLNKYLLELDELEKEIQEIIHSLPKEKRKLVTAHDAFSYFGKKYDFDIISIQGISTATEAGVKDIRKVTDYIVEHEVKAIFIESSVPKRSIDALQKAVISRGFHVEIGGMLFSDALGNPDSNEGTYIGMFKKNVQTIVSALK